MATTLQDADFAVQQADAAWTLARSRVANSEARLARRSDSYGTDAIGIAARARDQALLDQANQEASIAQTAYNAALANYKSVYAAEGKETPAVPPATPSTPAASPITPSQSATSVETQNPSSTTATEQAAGPQATEFEPKTTTDPAVSTDVAEDAGYTPLEKPPGTDEYDGLDQQITDNENGLQEPPSVDPDEDPFEAERLAAEERLNNTPEITEAEILAGSGSQGLSSAKSNATSGATNQDQNNFVAQEDWRIRLTLSPKADYLYKSKTPGILKPLADTNGVIFPYTPNISISYSANYDATDLVHSNYKVYQYKNSNVDNISITCDFTAQDTYEANYLLAVIHFFRSVTKMFYGQDNGPKPGTPPPLCFLIGLGEFQFNDHPLAITAFNYVLPSDVDYIRAGSVSGPAGVNQQSSIRPVNTYDVSSVRLQGIKPGGSPLDPEFGSLSGYKANVTYVPTKMQIQLSAIPIVSRNDVSNNFSLNDYASGKLLRGIQNVRGGFW